MIVLNSFGNCTTDTKGTGSRSCDLKTFGDPNGIVLFKKGEKFVLETDTLNAAGWKAKIKGFDVFPLVGLYNFEQATPENEKNTSSTGVLSEIRDGKPQFSFMYDKGSCFHKSLYDKRGKGRWDLGILFDTGILLAVADDNLSIGGFDMGLFSVETFKFIVGSDPQMSTAMVQLLDAFQFNAKHEFFSWQQLGVNLGKIDGVVETVLSYPADLDPGTTVRVKVASACNVDDVILDLDDEELWALGGTQTSATTISSVAFNVATEDYTLTVSPALIATDTIQPSLRQSGLNAVEDSAGNMFKGSAAIGTITA